MHIDMHINFLEVHTELTYGKGKSRAWKTEKRCSPLYAILYHFNFKHVNVPKIKFLKFNTSY